MKTRVIKQGNTYKPQYRRWWMWFDFDRRIFPDLQGALNCIEEETRKENVVWGNGK